MMVLRTSVLLSASVGNMGRLNLSRSTGGRAGQESGA
jgi:hypothetical protein